MRGVEFRHHFIGEQPERFTDVLVGVLAGLVEQHDLVDVDAWNFRSFLRMVSGEPIRPPRNAAACASAGFLPLCCTRPTC